MGRIGSRFPDLFSDSFVKVIFVIIAFVVVIAILGWLFSLAKLMLQGDWDLVREELAGVFQLLGCLGMFALAIWAYSWVI